MLSTWRQPFSTDRRNVNSKRRTSSPHHTMKNACQQCGFPYDPSEQKICPKCQIAGDQFGYLTVLEVDVVHSGESWPIAKEKIERGLDHAIYHHHKGLKIIHGYGSLSGSSVIAPQAIAYMRHLADSHDARFAKDAKNPGASIIWLNRKGTPRSQSENAPEWAKYTTPSLSTAGQPAAGNWFDQALKRNTTSSS